MSADLKAVLWVTVVGVPVLFGAMLTLIAGMYALTVGGRRRAAATPVAPAPPRSSEREQRRRVAAMAAAILQSEGQRSVPPAAADTPSNWRLARRLARLSVGEGRRTAR